MTILSVFEILLVGVLGVFLLLRLASPCRRVAVSPSLRFASLLLLAFSLQPLALSLSAAPDNPLITRLLTNQPYILVTNGNIILSTNFSTAPNTNQSHIVPTWLAKAGPATNQNLLLANIATSAAGVATNAIVFWFELSPDGTNYCADPLFKFSRALPTGATNYWFSTNIPDSVVAGAVSIRLAGMDLFGATNTVVYVSNLLHIALPPPPRPLWNR